MYQTQYIYSRERRRFGRQPLLSDRTQLMLSIQPSHRIRSTYILRNPMDRTTQLSEQMAFSWVETENVTYGEHGMYHYEGGWPREVNINDEESTMRYRKKIERDDNWGMQVTNLIHTSIDVTAQNSAVNIYQEFFVDLPPELGKDIRTPFEARQCNIFHDPQNPVRPITVIDWMPNEKKRFLSQPTNFNFTAPVRPPPLGVKTEEDDLHSTPSVPSGILQVTESSRSVLINPNFFYVWNMANALQPEIVLDSTEPVHRAHFCPRDENFIAAGLHSGMVGLWDARNGGKAIKISPLEAAHREEAAALCWVHSKSNSEFYSGSYDGSVKYWDIRDLNTPLQEIWIDPELTDEQKRERAHGVTVLEFEYTIPVRYIIASDQGYVFIGNRKGMVPTEVLIANYRLFSGPVRTIERNPFFVKNFLIAADWCVKIWAEECKGAPTTLLMKKKNEMLCGTWSPSRCSLFVTGDAKGEVDFWDLLLHQRKPIFTLKLKRPVKYVKFRPDGKYLAVGLENGDVQLFEMDPALRQSAAKDKALLMALFERELQHCKLLDGRVEEIKLKHKTELYETEQAKLRENELDLVVQYDPDDPDQFLQIIENDTEFKDMLKIFKDSTFNIDKKRQERQFIMERTDFEKDGMLTKEDLEGLTAGEIAAVKAEGLVNSSAAGAAGAADGAAGIAGAGDKAGAGAPGGAGAAVADDKEAAVGDKRIKVLRRMADADN
ncbi:PREDICTED: dynein intermediate chain 3, ciliary [Rhagoletis zephyria]|uniref:dynein intermediate chain 3, ciliary n=1 Tax=Rhagoletis zephyria TaxID=28612 RepID=UPI000811AA6E|nr:PREDICTED: dynein intermediate chain 3, ciliary [Rhagoletis zephyria]